MNFYRNFFFCHLKEVAAYSLKTQMLLAMILYIFFVFYCSRLAVMWYFAYMVNQMNLLGNKLFIMETNSLVAFKKFRDMVQSNPLQPPRDLLLYFSTCDLVSPTAFFPKQPVASDLPRLHFVTLAAQEWFVDPCSEEHTHLRTHEYDSLELFEM